MFSRTFREVCEWYLDNMGKLGLSISDQQTKHSAAKLLIKAFGSKVLSHGQVRARERLDRMSIREWKIQLEKDGYAQATIQKYLIFGSTVIKTAWNEKDWDLPNPFDGMATGLKPVTRRRVVTEQEQAALILALPQPYKDICLLILETGMRASEALNLEWDRVDTDGGWFSFKEGELTGTGGSKSQRADRAALSTRAKEIILKQPKTGPKVFGRVPYYLFRRAFQRARKAAGVAHCTPHDLRRTLGYRLRANGVSLDAIQVQLRHASYVTTERVYAQAQPEKALEVLRVLNRA